MSKIILTVGLPGSGKTTWANEEMAKNPGRYKNVNKDDLRAMIDNSHWSRKNESFILAVRDQIVRQALKDGLDVIVSDTNLDSSHKEQMLKIVADFPGTTVEEKSFLDVSIDTCIERDLKRSRSVGEKIIRQMYERYIRKDAAAVEIIPGLPSAIICDLDGTLAILNGRDPYNASTCFNDGVNTPVQQLVNQMKQLGHAVIFMSGRESKYRTETIMWLETKAHVKYDGLFMRETGDSRKDSLVKKELYEREVKGKYNVQFVLDDRDQVVELWRSLGLPCFQVNYGNF